MCNVFDNLTKSSILCLCPAFAVLANSLTSTEAIFVDVGIYMTAYVLQKYRLYKHKTFRCSEIQTNVSSSYNILATLSSSGEKLDVFHF